jgi:hypothetical protein
MWAGWMVAMMVVSSVLTSVARLVDKLADQLVAPWAMMTVERWAGRKVVLKGYRTAVP